MSTCYNEHLTNFINSHYIKIALFSKNKLLGSHYSSAMLKSRFENSLMNMHTQLATKQVMDGYEKNSKDQKSGMLRSPLTTFFLELNKFHLPQNNFPQDLQL
jgi:hypothetical protein